jgi:elongation factor Ts
MRSQLADQGKPTKLFEKILDGRMAKFYEETCLVKQKFVLNDKKTVAEWLEGADGSLGSLHVSAFVRINPDEVVVARLPDLD